MPSTCPMRLAFSNHQQRALRSHIGFEFSFAEWCQWWREHLGENWLSLRGRREGQYVMARVGDTGPYHSSLVKCVTSGQNSSEAMHLREESHYWAKLSKDQVIEARRTYVPHSPQFGSRALARKYGVGPAAIGHCLRGTCWKRVPGARSEKSGRLRKLTDDIVREARRRYRPGDFQNGASALAREFGVSLDTMWGAVTRKTWQHVGD